MYVFLLPGKAFLGGGNMRRKRWIPETYPIGSLLRIEQEGIVTDPLGSYTGIAKDPLEQPIQDADDL